MFKKVLILIIVLTILLVGCKSEELQFSGESEGYGAEVNVLEGESFDLAIYTLDKTIEKIQYQLIWNNETINSGKLHFNRDNSYYKVDLSSELSDLKVRKEDVVYVHIEEDLKTFGFPLLNKN